MAMATRSPFGSVLRVISMSKSIADIIPSPNSSSISAFIAGPLTRINSKIEQGVGRWHWRTSAPHRHLVEQGLLVLRQAEQLGGICRLRLGKLVLAENCSRHQNRRHTADLLADVFPIPALLTLDIEKFFGQSGPCHDILPSLISELTWTVVPGPAANPTRPPSPWFWPTIGAALTSKYPCL